MILWKKSAVNSRSIDGGIDMKRCLYFALLVTFLISLTACGGKTDIVGTWEQETEIAILGEGIEKATTAASSHRFTFREDGTGIQEHIVADGSYPNAVREFHWQLEGDTLTLVYAENQTEEFTAVLSKTSLKLENRRGGYDLTRVE